MLNTPWNTRATSPTVRFFHVLNLKVRPVLDVSMVLGLGVSIRKDDSMAYSMCSNPAPPYALNRQTVAFSLNTEQKSMTITAPKMGLPGNTPTTSPASITRRVAIEAALTLALFHVQNGNAHAAVGRSIRATSMLKQACAESQIGGAK